MKSRIVEPSPDHKAAHTDLCTLLYKYAGKMNGAEMLALSAHVTGQILALQDQRTMTRDRALVIVMENLEKGNAMVINSLGKTAGSA